MSLTEAPRFIYLAKGVSERNFVRKFPAFKPYVSRAVTDDVAIVVKPGDVEASVNDTDNLLIGVLNISFGNFAKVSKVLSKMVRLAQDKRVPVQDVVKFVINEFSKETV